MIVDEAAVFGVHPNLHCPLVVIHLHSSPTPGEGVGLRAGDVP